MSDPSNHTPAVNAFWEAFRKADNQLAPDTPDEVWYFGDSRQLADELAELVVSGKKIATASLYWEYEAEGEALPQVGGYSVITDYDGGPRGVIQTIEVRILGMTFVKVIKREGISQPGHATAEEFMGSENHEVK